MNRLLNIRVCVYIDGSNLYHKLKDLKIRNTTKFNYAKLCDYLCAGRQSISRRYYVGIIKTKNTDLINQAKREKQLNLLNALERQSIIIKKGYLMNNKGVFHEKGVDVKIAVDLLVGAYENLYNTAIIISSDTDLIPAILKIKHLGKNVEYISFKHQVSFALKKHANYSMLLTKKDLESFLFK